MRQLERQEQEKALLNTSATKIQSAYRGHVARRQLRENSARISKVQLKFRSWLSEKRERERTEKERVIDREATASKVSLMGDCFPVKCRNLHYILFRSMIGHVE